MNMTSRGKCSMPAETTPADQAKLKLIHGQLVLLLHAYKCSKKEQSGNVTNCSVLYCKVFKGVLNHMDTCSQRKPCEVLNCTSSQHIIAHWRVCDSQGCRVCMPLKTIPNYNASNASSMQLKWPTVASLKDSMLDADVSQDKESLPNGIASSQAPGTANVGQGSQDWPEIDQISLMEFAPCPIVMKDKGTVSSPSTVSVEKSNQILSMRCMRMLEHACRCKSANCKMRECFKLNKVILHAKNCKKISNNSCPICRQFIALCYFHAKHCQEKKCPVAFCHNIKAKLKEQERQHRTRNAHLMQRRMKIMSQRSSQKNGPQTTEVATSTPSLPKPKLEDMRLRQPSPMNATREIFLGEMGQESYPTNNQGMPTSPRADCGWATPLICRTQTVNPSSMMEPVQFEQYQSSPAIGAIMSTKKAQELLAKQVKESDRLNPLAPYLKPNTLTDIGPMRSPTSQMASAVKSPGGASGMNNSVCPPVAQGKNPVQQRQQQFIQQSNMMTPPMGSMEQQTVVGMQHTLNQSGMNMQPVQENQDASTSAPTKPNSSEQSMALVEINPEFLRNTIIEADTRQESRAAKTATAEVHSAEQCDDATFMQYQQVNAPNAK